MTDSPPLPESRASTGSRRMLVVAVLGGLAVGAAAVGIAWAASAGSGSGTGSGDPLTMPARLGPLVRFSDVPLNRTGIGKQGAIRFAAWNARSQTLLSQAYDGASAAVQTYSDAQLERLLTLTVVRAQSPRPFVLYQDAKTLDLVRPPEEVRRFGDVYCRLENAPTGIGSTPTPDSVTVVLCARTGPSLTVSAQASGPLGHNPSAVAALIDEAWGDIAPGPNQ